MLLLPLGDSCGYSRLHQALLWSLAATASLVVPDGLCVGMVGSGGIRRQEEATRRFDSQWHKVETVSHGHPFVHSAFPRCVAD